MVERYLILTIGKTHSGKSTFARKLEKKIKNAVVIDQDEHATFLQSVYSLLVPRDGENKLKYSITRGIVDYTISNTTYHMILCNANLNEVPRTKLVNHFKEQGFKVIAVKFDLPIQIIKSRILNNNRDTTILRTVTSYEEVLNKQDSIAIPENVLGVDIEFSILDEKDVQIVIKQISRLIH